MNNKASFSRTASMLLALLCWASSAMANILTNGTVAANCQGYTVNVNAGLLEPVCTFDANYSIVLSQCVATPRMINGKVFITRNSVDPTTGSGSVSATWDPSLTLNGTCMVTGTATLTQFPSTVELTPVPVSFTCTPPTPGIKITKFTNGHDADNANGVPSAVQGSFSVGANTVAEVLPGAPIVWTYRVTNTGNEPLVSVLVNDNRIGPASCPKDMLAVGESMDCTRTGIAASLLAGLPNVQGCGSGGTAQRPTYENRGTATAFGSASGTQLTDNNDSHYCNPPSAPACNLTMSKTCEIVQSPSTSDWASCRGKLQQFSLIWPSGGGTVNISGIANNAPGGVVNPGQKVVFTGPFSTNDQVLNITGGATGSSTFHVSCSDKDMDGLTLTNLEQQQLPGKSQDCGKFQGNGKAAGSGFINTWLLDGLVDADGKVLNCSAAPTPTTSSCSFLPQDPPSCGTGGSFKPSTLTFQYTGGGCTTQSNTQAADKTSCSGRIDPTKAVNVVFPGGSASNVQPGGTFTIARTQTNSIITLSNAGGTETDGIHTSCSQPLVVGDIYFSLTLVAEDGIGVGKDVKYAYKLTNTGATTISNIAVMDDKLGPVPGSPILSLAPGASQTLSASARISQTTTNVATATGSSCPTPGVTATATVTVLPAPACSVSQNSVALADDNVVYKVANTGNKVVTLETLTLNFPGARQQVKSVQVGKDVVYDAGKSSLAVLPGSTIGAGNWTNADVTKRQWKAGETQDLRITFTKKAKATASEFSGRAAFKEGCEVDLSP
jgi:hypothetical protein